MSAPDFSAERLPSLPRKPFALDTVRPGATRAVTFTAWCIPDDGQKRTKGFGVTLPIEGPRFPASVSEGPRSRRTGRPAPAPGYRIDVSQAETLREALDKAKSYCSHKAHLTILEEHAGHATSRLHVYSIKQDSTPKYRGPLNTERYHQLYEFHLFDLDVAAFEPKGPADAARDPVGRDLQLVEGGR